MRGISMVEFNDVELGVIREILFGHADVPKAVDIGALVHRFNVAGHPFFSAAGADARYAFVQKLQGVDRRPPAPAPTSDTAAAAAQVVVQEIREYCEYMFSPQWLADPQNRSIFAAHVYGIIRDGAATASSEAQGVADAPANMWQPGREVICDHQADIHPKGKWCVNPRLAAMSEVASESSVSGSACTSADKSGECQRESGIGDPSSVAPAVPTTGQPPCEVWRVGTHYGIHLYEGTRPVATFHRPEDAALAARLRAENAALTEKARDAIAEADIAETAHKQACDVIAPLEKALSEKEAELVTLRADNTRTPRTPPDPPPKPVVPPAPGTIFKHYKTGNTYRKLFKTTATRTFEQHFGRWILHNVTITTDGVDDQKVAFIGTLMNGDVFADRETGVHIEYDGVVYIALDGDSAGRIFFRDKDEFEATVAVHNPNTGVPDRMPRFQDVTVVAK